MMAAYIIINKNTKHNLKQAYRLLVKETDSKASYEKFLKVFNRHIRNVEQMFMYYDDNDVCYSTHSSDSYEGSDFTRINIFNKNTIGGKLL